MQFFRDLAGVLFAVTVALAATPAWADSVHIGGTENITNQGGAGGAGGAAAASASSSATATTVTTIQNSQSQGQQQGQHQGQAQGQIQGQNNDQNISPSQSVKIDGTSFDRYAPTVVAPSLTAAGTGVCLGSVSIGLSGPMAGASFGITKVDKGCERRSASALLFQYGYKDAALRLLMKDDEVREAVGSDAPAAVKKAAAIDVPALTLSTVLGSEATYNAPLTVKEVAKRQSIPEAMADTQAARVSAVQQ